MSVIWGRSPKRCRTTCRPDSAPKSSDVDDARCPQRCFMWRGRSSFRFRPRMLSEAAAGHISLRPLFGLLGFFPRPPSGRKARKPPVSLPPDTARAAHTLRKKSTYRRKAWPPSHRRHSPFPCGLAERRHPRRHKDISAVKSSGGAPVAQAILSPAAHELEALGPPPVPNTIQNHLQFLHEEDRLRLLANRRSTWDCSASSTWDCSQR